MCIRDSVFTVSKTPVALSVSPDTGVSFVLFNTDVLLVLCIPPVFTVSKAPNVLPVSNNTIPKQVTKINNFLF